MKRLSSVAILAAMAFVAAIFVQNSSAQQATDSDAVQDSTQRREVRRAQTDRNAGPANAGQLDTATRGANIRASELIGTDIQNPNGEDIGEIEDLVIDSSSREVRYAAVSYGGFLGLGDKLFAVPFEKFQVQQDPEDADEYVLMLDVTEQQLENAQGFDEDNWPNFADNNFTSQVDRTYGVQRQNRESRPDGRGANRNQRNQ